MKKLNKKGFTLIELLAVITIMGILLMVGIPAYQRYLDNARRDTFKDTAKTYVKSVSTLWASDSIYCGGVTSSAVDPGYYYVSIYSADDPVLLESGGKSSWGNKDVEGYVLIRVKDTAVDGQINRQVLYSIGLVDTAGNGISAPKDELTKNNDYHTLSRKDVKSVGVNADPDSPIAIGKTDNTDGIAPIKCNVE